MPFIRVDADMYDEMFAELGEEVVGSERPSDEFVYKSAEGKFEQRKLSKEARLIADALVAAGATAFRVTYDGGFDEGFAHPDTVWFGKQSRRADDAIKQINSAALVSALREEAKGHQWSAERAAKAPDIEMLRDGLAQLAHEIASVLLGDGFGTGEYQLYGALTADLKTRQITDDENAKRPADMD